MILAGALSAEIPAAAFGEEEAVAACPSGAPEVIFSAPIPPTNYLYDKSVNAIQFMMRDNGHIFAGMDDTWILGVTFAKPMFTVDADIETTPVENGFCAKVKTVRATFGYDNMDVYIGSDFKPGTCAFKATYDHEYQHVSVNTYTLQEYAKRVQAKLEGLAAAETARVRPEEFPAQEPLLAPYRAVLESAVKEFQQVQASRNAALDTPQSYARTQALCDDWNQSYTWTKKSPVQRAPAQSPVNRESQGRRPVQRAPAEMGRH
jgi:hypothetical protein